MTTLLVVDHVLMRVSVGREARRGGKEVFKRANVDCRVKYQDRERSGRWRGRGGDGGDRCSDNGWGNVLDGDVLERVVVDNITDELKVAPTILVEQGKEEVEFGLGKADDVGGGFFSKLFEVKLGGGTKCLLSGLRSRW